MATLADLRPGDIMFAKKVRPLAADLLILRGQLILGQPGYPHHVAVVTAAAQTMTMVGNAEQMLQAAAYLRGPKIVQAMPSGAEEIEIGAEHWTSDYTYVRPAYVGGKIIIGDGDESDNLMMTQAEGVAWHARRYIGVPYSFADYAAIAGVHFGIKNGPIRRYVTTSKHMICSQLADQAMSDAGFHVFDDERLPQDVTPAALYVRLRELPGTQLIFPGKAS